MDRGSGNSTELSYHRRRAAQERSLGELATGAEAALCHRRLAAMHGERVRMIEQSAALIEKRWAGPQIEA